MGIVWFNLHHHEHAHRPHLPIPREDICPVGSARAKLSDDLEALSKPWELGCSSMVIRARYCWEVEQRGEVMISAQDWTRGF